MPQITPCQWWSRLQRRPHSFVHASQKKNEVHPLAYKVKHFPQTRWGSDLACIKFPSYLRISLVWGPRAGIMFYQNLWFFYINQSWDYQNHRPKRLKPLKTSQTRFQYKFWLKTGFKISKFKKLKKTLNTINMDFDSTVKFKILRRIRFW